MMTLWLCCSFYIFLAISSMSLSSCCCWAEPTILHHHKWIVSSLPNGKFKASRHLKMITKPIDDYMDVIQLEPDQVMVRVEAFSVDAFVRTMLEKDSFHLFLKPGSMLRAVGYGTVVRAGSNQAYKVGSRVYGMLPVSNIAIVGKSQFLHPMTTTATTPLPGIILTRRKNHYHPWLYLTLLGNSGLSAYIGLFLVPCKNKCNKGSGGPPRKGETVVISAAAGGTGSLAAQMAKLTGARVVGIAGGSQKKQFLLETLGLDAVIDYKGCNNKKSLREQLKETCPNGVDFFFDNVGGDILDAVLDNINHGARIIICGAISQYDTGKLYTSPQGPRNYLKLAERSATMSGFEMGYYLKSPRNVVSAFSYILWHYYRGNLTLCMDVHKGIESFGKCLEMLLNGQNTGKLIVDVDM